MGTRDLVLFMVIFASAATAVTWPDHWWFLQPFLLYFMMLLLFLSFLKIDFHALLDTSWSATGRLALLTVAKLIILPTVLYLAARRLIPEFAVPILLLSGISTGVVGPFIANLVGANLALVLRMVIVTSLLVPFTLPVLVEILAGASIAIPLGLMMRLLGLVIFIPIAGVVILRRIYPDAPAALAPFQYPISLAIFGVINLGVFSKYSEFIFDNPGKLLTCVVLVYVLSILFWITGYVLLPGRGHGERLGAGVSMAIMNNVLVIVFSAQFFGALSPTLAAMYMLPFFTMIVPVKLLAQWFGKSVTEDSLQ
jgi:BASS family bile acid:Na+ symporter